MKTTQDVKDLREDLQFATLPKVRIDRLELPAHNAPEYIRIRLERYLGAAFDLGVAFARENGRGPGKRERAEIVRRLSDK
jgi:hypothetical protein